jgi:hypothetical protein
LKVIVQPADHSAIVAANGPAQFVPAAQLEQSRQQIGGRGDCLSGGWRRIRASLW